MLRLIQRIVRWTGYWFFFFVKNFNVKFVQAYYYYYTTIVSWFELFFFFFFTINRDDIRYEYFCRNFTRIYYDTVQWKIRNKQESLNRVVEIIIVFYIIFFFFFEKIKINLECCTNFSVQIKIWNFFSFLCTVLQLYNCILYLYC